MPRADESLKTVWKEPVPLIAKNMSTDGKTHNRRINGAPSDIGHSFVARRCAKQSVLWTRKPHRALGAFVERPARDRTIDHRPSCFVNPWCLSISCCHPARGYGRARGR